jgi:phosphate-selective porin OprO/OprP
MNYRTRATISGLGVLLLASFFVLTVTPTVEAQSLEERVQELEERMQDDELPADKYVDEFGGRIMADWTFNTSQSDNYFSQLGADAEDGFEFRRLRLFAEGEVAEDISYKTQLDFAGNEVAIKSVYLNFDDVGPLPYVKVGNFKEPFSLEEQTSSKYITFMSRTALTDALSQARQPGIQTGYHTADEKLNFTVGAFNPQNGQQSSTNGSWDLSGRLTSPVLYQNGGEQLVHLGLSYSLRGEDGAGTTAIEPEVHKGDPEMLGVTLGNVDNSAVSGLELATVFGPTSFQAEWSNQAISRTSGSDVDLSSYYAMVSYILTGESRPYDPAAGDFGRIDVENPYRDGGMGAFELAARFSSTDFTDAQGQQGGAPYAGNSNLAGEMDVLTLGTNWYPSAHTKLMLNYVDATQNDADVDGQWVTTRFQVDF